jgi:hypothetical protein
VWGGKLRDKKKSTIKYVVDLDGHVTIFHVQQPTKNMWAGWSACIGAGVTRGEQAEGMKPLFWGSFEVKRR